MDGKVVSQTLSVFEDAHLQGIIRNRSIGTACLKIGF